MFHRSRAALVALLAVFLAAAGAGPVLAGSDQGTVRGIDPADMDLTVDPGVDFYRFANGGWLDRTAIPADAGSYGVFRELRDETTRQLIDLLNELAGSGAVRPDSDEWKALELFRQGIDVAARDAAGIAPIRPLLVEIDAIADLDGFHRFLQGSMFDAVPGLLPVHVYPDLKASGVYGTYLGGPWLGLPNRDYYLEDDETNGPIREAYVATNAELLGYLGYDPDRARAAAQAVYDLERRLAEPTLTREEQQDVSLAYNPMTVADLAARYPLMDWAAYLQALDLGSVSPLIVTEVRYLDALAPIVRETPVETLKDYARLQVLWTFSDSLSLAIEETAFDFQGRVLGGVEEMRPLDERSLAMVDATVGQALGKLYVAEYFPPEAKAQIEELVANLKVAFGERLEANGWMTPETKAKALEKLTAMRVKVGYPDVWRSYEAVEIGGSYAESLLDAGNAEVRRSLSKAGQPVDREEWATPPQTVNAYYSPLNNEIVFPAGILQSPFFDYRADPASNYGGIGFVIGHEITHGFDRTGSQFDAEGNLVNWWSPGDHERFRALNDRVVAQFAAIEVLPGVFLDGQVTVTENVADLGGVQVAYDALGRHLAAEGRPLPAPPFTEPLVGPRFTQEQRFFIAAATVWRQKVREEALVTQVKTGPHSPAEVRAVEPIRNMDAFFDAFGIAPGDPMYLPSAERVVIW